MKTTLAALYLLVAFSSLASAQQQLTVNDVGITIAVPEDWTHDGTDNFGYLIRPKDQKNQKIRIHLTGYKGIPPSEAVESGAKKIKEIRDKNGNREELVLSSTPVTTNTGIKGQIAEVGQQGADGLSYLTRMYFERKDGRIFCVCIYHYGDMKFATKAKAIVIDTLTLKNNSIQDTGA